jgi:hypothetical protein
MHLAVILNKIDKCKAHVKSDYVPITQMSFCNFALGITSRT